IDVSFTAVAVVSGYLAARTSLALGVDNLALVLAVAIGVGLVLGAINAALIHWLRLPTLIVTLGTMSVYHGGMAVLLGMTSYPASAMPQSMVAFGTRDLVDVQTETGRYGLTVFLPLVLVALVVTWFVLNRTMLGRSVYAVGSNEESASRLGISLFRTKLFV